MPVPPSNIICCIDPSTGREKVGKRQVQIDKVRGYVVAVCPFLNVSVAKVWVFVCLLANSPAASISSVESNGFGLAIGYL